MSFSVADFISRVSRYGLARDNLFIVRITPPAGLFEGTIPMNDLVFFCRSVDLPALTLETTSVKTQGWGKAESFPINLPYDNLNTVFMIDAEFKVKKFFQRWMQSIVNYDNSRSNAAYNGMKPFQIAYKDKYVGTVEVVVYSLNDNKITYEYKFENAYPISLGNITTAWDNNNEIMVMPVTFTYGSYSNAGMGESTILNTSGISGNYTSGSSSRLGGAFGTIDAVFFDNRISNVVNRVSSTIDRIGSFFR